MSGFTMPLEDCSMNRSGVDPVSAMHNLSCQKPKPKPVRVNTLLRFYGSDDDESEEKSSKLDNESDLDELQSLPDDSDGSFEMNETQPIGSNSSPQDRRTDNERVLNSSELKDSPNDRKKEAEQDRCENRCSADDVQSESRKLESTNDERDKRISPGTKNCTRSAEIELKPSFPDDQPEVNFLQSKTHSDPSPGTNSRSNSHQGKFRKIKSGLHKTENQLMTDSRRFSDIGFAPRGHQDFQRTAYSKCMASTPLVPMTAFNGKQYSNSIVDARINLRENIETSLEANERLLLPEDASQSRKTGISLTAEMIPPGSAVSQPVAESPMNYPLAGPKRPELSSCHRSLMQNNGKLYSESSIDPHSNLLKNNETSLEGNERLLFPEDASQPQKTTSEIAVSHSVAESPMNYPSAGPKRPELSSCHRSLMQNNGKLYSESSIDPHINLRKNNESSLEENERLLLPEDASQPQKNTSEIAVSHSVAESPMNYHPAGSKHPELSLCHRSLMQTPQTKPRKDISSNNVQTPASILSHWAYGDMLQTPTQNNISKAKENIQMSGQPIQNPSNPRIETPRYFGKDTRGVRRPLAEAMHLSHDSNLHQNGRTYIANPREALSRSSYLPKIPEGSFQAKARSSTKENQPVESQVREVSRTVKSKAPRPSNIETITVKDTEYLVLGTLGQGMSGKVLRVQNMESGEQRAIKCVDMSRIDKEAAQGSLEEVSVLFRLQAPCVITMFDYEIVSPMLYVVLELGDTDLSRLLKASYQEEGLSLTMILYFWTEMLTAVKHIHDHGVIHQDLKPANFLLVRGRLKLIDFGIASSLNADMTSVVKNSTIGTLNYISPEALKDIGGSGDSPNHDQKYKISYKADVWSLGCILYSMIYGRTPFQHIRQTWAKMNAITNPAQKIMFPPPSAAENAACLASPPAILVEVMRRCLLRDPKARPTVAQLLQIPYVSGGSALPPAPKIPAAMLSKIKRALTEDEWRHFTEILEQRGPVS